MLSVVRQQIVWILILTLLPALLLASTEEAEQALLSKYKNAEVQQWSLDSDGNWEVSFILEGTIYRALFSEAGEWIYTETTIDQSETPAAVREAFSNDLKDSTVELIESIDHAQHGRLFEVLTNTDGRKKSFQFRDTGERFDSLLLPRDPQKDFDYLSTESLIIEFLLNLIVIIIFAWGIYYRRHHDHEMLFLLLSFNLFLFPIFLVSNNLTAGMGFTIFALLAFVRLRSDPFTKTEIAYLLGAVALTFINGQLHMRAELIGDAFVLLTAYVADHPRIWRDPKYSVQLRYKMGERAQILDHEQMKQRLSKEFNIEVQNVRITAINGDEVRMVVTYRKRSGPGTLTGSAVVET